jgi:hypothetical protein
MLIAGWAVNEKFKADMEGAMGWVQNAAIKTKVGVAFAAVLICTLAMGSFAVFEMAV